MPDGIVVDASVALELLLPGEWSEHTLALVGRAKLIAPDLMQVEPAELVSSLELEADMETADGLVIRPPRADDRAQWQPLWDGYLSFYRTRLDPAVTELTWTRLIESSVQPHGLAAELPSGLVGFATYLFHRSTWSFTSICYLEDLFVLPEARGQGVARRLIESVYAAADKARATSVYWHTQEFNADGRALYDTLAHRTSFIVYQR